MDSAPYRAGAGPWTVINWERNERWRLGGDESFEAPLKAQGRQARIGFGIHEAG